MLAAIESGILMTAEPENVRLTAPYGTTNQDDEDPTTHCFVNVWPARLLGSGAEGRATGAVL